MNRRQFLLGVSAAALASATASKAVAIGVDLASGPDRTAHWIIESTPGHCGTYFHDLFLWVAPDAPSTIQYSEAKPDWWDDAPFNRRALWEKVIE